jgi:catechol 2,3-dioxygenase-like lactoylglutathione lyase family enzyme
MPARNTPREHASPREPEILGAHPQIFVTDIRRAVAFYRDRLGFACEYLYGEPPFYAALARGGARLNLRHVDALPFDVAERSRERLLAATIVVRNAKALFLTFKEAGLDFHQPYREQPWGAHDFIVADPDGNLVHFASPVGEP